MSYYGEPDTFSPQFIREFGDKLEDAAPTPRDKRRSWVVVEALKNVNRSDDQIKTYVGRMQGDLAKLRADVDQVAGIHGTGLGSVAFDLERAVALRAGNWDMLVAALTDTEMAAVRAESVRNVPAASAS
jgi:hypothetical protein